MKRPALFVIALGGRIVEALADRDVVREEIPGDGFGSRALARIYRDHIHRSRRVIDADHERLDALERHEEYQGESQSERNHPTGPGYTECKSYRSPTLGNPVRIPGGGFGKV